MPDPAFFKRDQGTRGCSLFEQAASSPLVAPSVATDTSEDAAVSITGSGRVQSAWHVILALLTIHPELTTDEIEVRTGWTGNFLRPRIKEMYDHQWLEKSDVKRPTRSGCMARAVKLTPLGHIVAQNEAEKAKQQREGR